MIRHIIFYGTLMNKCGARGLRLADEGVDYIKEITIPGVLHSMGPYPALVMGEGKVKGELFRINNKDVMNTFDGIEGYGKGHPDHHLYTRTVVWVDDIKDFAWVYTYNDSINPESRIESGDWYEHIQSR